VAEELKIPDFLRGREKTMRKKTIVMFLNCMLLTGVGIEGQEQHPILDQVANKVIQKYQSATCQQLWAERAQKAPPTPQEQKAIQFLKSDPQMRTLFLNKVAAPIANKMFECGMIP
jgi:hypothetical protein